MYRSILRTINTPSITCKWTTPRCGKKSAVVISGKHATDQITFIETEIDNNYNSVDWAALKSNTLSINGSMTEKNIDAVILKLMVTSKKLDPASSFANHLRQANPELSIGIVNGLLALYYEISKTRKLTDDEKNFILNSYKDLYAKYKLLDTTTCERLLHALCAIDEWKKTGKVLNDIHLSGKPTHSAYSTYVSMLFRTNKKTEALKVIEESVNKLRPLRHDAYESWINYVLRTYKDKKTVLKYLEGICEHVSKNWIMLSWESADVFQKLYAKAGWDVHCTQIRKIDGQCSQCKETLTPLQLTEEEFQKLQQIIKDKLIVGSDLFLKTSPEELKKFMQFIENTGPYDIVLDALNIAFSVRGSSKDKLSLLLKVVDNFKRTNMKILVLGRKHMLHWQKHSMQELTSKARCFFTEDLSQDDPFFITAAILSGSHTDIVSKDLLRGHRFNLHDERLRIIFRRWQWQHQWMVFINKFGKVIYQAPLKFDPYAQKNNGSWHVPFQSEEDEVMAQVNDGTPNLNSWMCLRPQIVTR